MLQALFINSNDEFISSTLGTENLVTPSYVQALDWLCDDTLPVAGIYLNPNDSVFSALQFLRQAMELRPATPLFILDEEGDFTPQNLSALSDKFKIRGSFKGKRNVDELLEPLRMQVPAELEAYDKRSSLKSMHSGYVAVPLIDFIYSKNYSANVFVEDESKQLRFFAMEGSEVDLEYLSYLGRKTSWLYIEESSIESRIASFRFVEASYLDPAYLSPSWRMAETFHRAKGFLHKLRKSGVSEDLTGETYVVLHDLFQLTSQVTQDVNLVKLVEQAKQSDQAISAVIFSALLCKILKFETQSIVETLGLASLLQDVSLYRTPYGNLVGANPKFLSTQAQAYFQNHPNLSADEVYRSGKVSELTLQIIRQQHERPDHTGFPNKVGGAQLQPLAEILSLVNSFLSRENESTEFYRHYSEKLTVPFQKLVALLK